MTATVPPLVRPLPRPEPPVNKFYLAAVALIGVQFYGVAAVDVAVSDIFFILFLLVWLRRRVAIPQTVRVAILSFIVAAGIATARGIALTRGLPVGVLTRMAGVLVVLAYYVVSSDVCRTPRNRTKVLRAFAVGAVAFNALFLIPPLKAVLVNIFIQPVPSRLSGGMYDHNSNATLLAAAILVAGTCAGLTRSSRMVVVGLGLYELVLTYSRTGYVALGAGVVTYVLLSGRFDPRALRRIAIAGVGAAVLAIVLGVPQLVSDHFARRPDTVSTRTEYIELSTRYFGDNPWFGAGFGAAKSEVGQIIHATSFSVLGEMGLVGFIPFAAIMIIPFRRALRRLRRPGAPRDLLPLFSVGVALFAGSFGIDGLRHRHWWVLLGALLGATYGPQLVTSLRRRTGPAVALPTAAPL